MVAYKRCQESQFNGGRLPRVHTMSTYFFLNLIMRGYKSLIQRLLIILINISYNETPRYEGY